MKDKVILITFSFLLLFSFFLIYLIQKPPVIVEDSGYIPIERVSLKNANRKIAQTDSNIAYQLDDDEVVYVKRAPKGLTGIGIYNIETNEVVEYNDDINVDELIYDSFSNEVIGFTMDYNKYKFEDNQIRMVSTSEVEDIYSSDKGDVYITGEYLFYNGKVIEKVGDKKGDVPELAQHIEQTGDYLFYEIKNTRNSYGSYREYAYNINTYEKTELPLIFDYIKEVAGKYYIVNPKISSSSSEVLEYFGVESGEKINPIISIDEAGNVDNVFTSFFESDEIHSILDAIIWGNKMYMIPYKNDTSKDLALYVGDLSTQKVDKVFDIPFDDSTYFTQGGLLMEQRLAEEDESNYSYYDFDTEKTIHYTYYDNLMRIYGDNEENAVIIDMNGNEGKINRIITV